jgi:thiol-disulfide isomerase/thioredoxin
MNKIMMRIALAICFFFVVSIGFSQNSKSPELGKSLGDNAEYLPLKPVVGDTVHIIYHAGNVNSHFSIHGDLYIVMTIFDQDWSIKIEWSKMRKNAMDFIYDKKIDSNTALMRASFVTLTPGVHDYLDPTIVIMVHGMDGFPVFNAFNCAMYLNNCEQNFELEINRYPYNYTAYRNKWLWLGLANGKKVLDVVKKDMKHLCQIKSNEYNLLNSLSYGYLLMNDEPKGREILLEMLNRDPGNPLNVVAVSAYYNLAEFNHFPSDKVKQVDDAVERAVSIRPASQAARWLMAKQKLKCSIAVLQKVGDLWIKDEPGNPLSYYALVLRLNDENVDLKKAEFLIEKLIDLTLRGHLRFYIDMTGLHYEYFLGEFYRIEAEISYKLDNLKQALSSIKTSQAFKHNDSDPKSSILEGDIWRKLGVYTLACQAYKTAWKLGVNAAKDKMREIYYKQNEENDFDSWFNELINDNKLDPAKTKKIAESSIDLETKNKKERCPEFKAKDLNGRLVSSLDWNGKVVVLNFWFTKCSPCKVEIPELNRLVNKYGNKVSFISIALDDNSALHDYLNKNKFLYQTVADQGGNISREFGIKIYPSHIVIDPEGYIYYRHIGGGSSIFSDLSGVIDRLLHN